MNPVNLKVTAKNTMNLLEEGEHHVEIVSITGINHIGSEHKVQGFKDPTPQLKIRFREVDGNRIFTSFLNLKGYKRDPKDPDKYLIEDGVRVEDEENTEGCMSIIQKMVWSCGYTEKDGEVSIASLEGNELSIGVTRNERNNLRLAYTNLIPELRDDAKETTSSSVEDGENPDW